MRSEEIDFAGFGGYLASATVLQSQVENDVRETPAPADPAQPRSFGEFVGQEETVRLLRTEVEAAKRERRNLCHILLYGPPGVGKSALAYVLAHETDAAVYESSGAEFVTQTDIIEALGRIGRLYDVSASPIIFLLDEADGMTRVASYVLHSLMLTGGVTWKGERFGGVPVSVIGTTNHMARVPRALKSRFQEIVLIDYYKPEELAEIARRSAARMGLGLTEEAAVWIGENAAGEPRKVIRRILRGIANLVGPRGHADLAVAKEALSLSGLRPKGLTRSQFEYLSFLSSCEDHTAGVNSVAAYLGEDPEDVRGEHEPYLIRSGMVRIGRGGRRITPAGVEYLSNPV